jgi:hypothetical protein
MQRAVFALSTFFLATTTNASQSPVHTLATAQQKLAAVTVPFVSNAGQWDVRAAFGAKTFAGTLFVTTDGQLVYGLPASVCPSKDARLPAASGACAAGTGQTLTESFITRDGKALLAKPHGYRPAESKVSYFLGGDNSKHQTNVNTYERVNLGDVFPGVNVQLRATGSNVEKIFTVAPQRDPSKIHIRLDGATSLTLGSEGELIAQTKSGPVSYTAPIAFQETADGGKEPVPVSYALNAATHTYGFALGDYDRARPLVIDPLLKSTYVGGSGSDAAYAIAVHPLSGDVYITGFTDSSGNNLTGAVGSYDATYNGGTGDVFVARLSSDLTRLVAATYLGGSSFDIGKAIAIHPHTGDVYVAGRTTSTTGFPAGVSAGVQPSHGGGFGDAFVAQFSADLKTLRATTYLGGNGDETAQGIAIHPVSGEVYVVGDTQQSGSNTFPVSIGALQTVYGDGGRDAFITNFSANLNIRNASTFLGGSGNDIANAITIDPVSGDLFVVGDTGSNGFPGSASGAQTTLNGSTDAFVSRINRLLSSVIRSTYLGAGSTDSALAVAIHPLWRELIVSGQTGAATSGAAFPGLAGAPQSTNGGTVGTTDAFITRLNLALTSVPQSTFLGSANGTESGRGLAINGDTGEIYIAGTSNSTPFLTPVVANEAYQTTLSANEMFVARYRADLRERMQVTYLGTNNNEFALGLAIHPVGGTVLVAGYTGSSSFPGTNGTPTAHSGSDDATVSAFTPDLTAYNTAPDAYAFIPQSFVQNGQFSTPNSKRMSNEARVVFTPLPPAPPNNVPAYITGSAGSEFCVSNTAGCCSNTAVACSGFSTGWITAPYRLASGDYVALRHDTPGEAATATTTLIIGGTATSFTSSTGSAVTRCDLSTSIATGTLAATREGLILLRAMLGLTGTAVTAGTGVTSSWATLRDQFNTYCGTNFQ